MLEKTQFIDQDSFMLERSSLTVKIESVIDAIVTIGRTVMALLIDAFLADDVIVDDLLLHVFAA
jgi:hypothetical protein